MDALFQRLSSLELSSPVETQSLLPPPILNSNINNQHPVTLEKPRPVGPPTSFHYFPLLPAEIRLNVWKFARPDPQLVQMRTKSSKERNDPVKIYSTAPIPGIVHACYEAREYALRYWYLDYPVDYKERIVPYFFNPRIDVLYLGTKTCLPRSLCRACFLEFRLLSRPSTPLYLAERLMFHWKGSERIFHSVAERYKHAKQIVFLSQRTGALTRNARLCQFEKSSVPFPAQFQESFQTMYDRARAQTADRVWRESYGVEHIFGVQPVYRPWELKRKRIRGDVGRGGATKRIKGLETVENPRKVGEDYRVPSWLPFPVYLAN